MPNEYMPIGFSLKGKRCLVVGGGHVALRKVEALLDYDCKLVVVAPEPVEKIGYFAEKGSLSLEKREYRSPEAGEYGLVISASDDKAVNESVAADCGKAGVPVNVVDNPPLCSFIFPAVVRRDSMSVAILTDGKAPFLAGNLRLILEEIFPDRWKKIVKLAGLFRGMVRRKWPKTPKKQGLCYGKFVSADWTEILKKNKKDEEMESVLEGMLNVPDEEEK
ncbi:bifunctional precorrin-2 dehydrogenase/sirohydrochlorin ferrochelatase [Elusimicrobiota bacterium]